MPRTFSFEHHREDCSVKTQCNKTIDSFCPRYCKMLLAFSWILGVLFGIALLWIIGSESKILLSSLTSAHVSVMGRLFSFLLPAVVLCFCMVARRPAVLALFLFLRALQMAFVLWGAVETSGVFQPIVVYLLLMRFLTGVLEFSFIACCDFGGRVCSASSAFFFISCVFLLASADVSVISHLVVSF